MKKILITAAVAGLACGVMAQETILSPSRELKLDFTEANVSMQKMARKLKPMAEKLEVGAKEMQDAIDAVKADPNKLNKAKFEKALAEHMRPVMRNIDMVLESELEMQCALEDVSAEVKRVTLRIKQDYQRNDKNVVRLKDEMREKVKELQKLASQVASEGENADRAKVVQMKRLQQQVTLGERRLKLQQQVVTQLKVATKSLATSTDNLEIASSNAQVWFENMASNRSAFRDLIRMRKDMATLANLGSAGAGKSLREMIDTFNKTMKQIDGVGNLLSQISGSMDAMETFNQDISFDVSTVAGAEKIDAVSLAEDILNKDFSYLDD